MKQTSVTSVKALLSEKPAFDSPIAGDETSSSYIRQLPSFLSWRDDAGLLRYSCETQAKWSYKRIRDWSDHAQSTTFRRLIALPRASQQRIVLAPWMCSRLYYTSQPATADIALLDQFIDLESRLNGQTLTETRGWTALGDRYFPMDADEWFNEWKPYLAFDRCHYDASRIEHIVLDACSPCCRQDLLTGWGSVSSPTPDQIKIIAARVSEALAGMDAVSAATARMVRASIQTLGLLSTPAFPKLIWSMSHRPFIGRTVLVNAHSEHWRLQHVIDGLIHEAIHSTIYKLQLASNLYSDHEAAETVTATSPWSGRSIALHSLTHACFVWFGLWSFWKNAIGVVEQADRFRDRAAMGFLNGDPLAILSREENLVIAEPVRKAIAEMAAIVQSEEKTG